MSEPTPQRVWRVSCTSCGAPVEFRSAASPMAVCSFCRSTMVREGDAIRRIGRSAELFDDHSPLKLGARGTHQGQPFLLIGRMQLAYQDEDGAQGRWTEWRVLFDDGREAFLSEDNGAYVLGFAQPAPGAPLPDLVNTPIGEGVIIAGKPWSLTSRVLAHVHAMEGELDRVPDQSDHFPVIELRNTEGEVLSIEPQARPPRLDIGRAVQLPELAMSGIADEKDVSEGRPKAKGIECPNCGAAVAPTLDSSQTIVCGSCKSVIDISKGLGGDLACYRQDNALEPLIPMGTVGRLQVGGRTESWQVVGYQERCEVGGDAEDEQVFWREYLLYNKARGFAFLVDAEDGWSIVRPLTGVPSGRGESVQWEGVAYKLRYSYNAMTTYVLGEFYWPVRKSQRTLNMDYAGTQGSRVLNREQTQNEVTWSAGQTLPADAVVKAFRIQDNPSAFKRDVSPWRKGGGLSTARIDVWLIVFVVIVIIALTRCSDDDDCDDVRSRYGDSSNEYQQCVRNAQSSGGYRGSGGSYGGYSSGGFHK